MATIDKIPLTNAESLNLLRGAYTHPFHLVDYDDETSALELAGGRAEEIGGYLYKINNGNFAVDISDTTGSTDGTLYYLGVRDTGTTVLAKLLFLTPSNIPTYYDGNKGGYYWTFGAETWKLIMSVRKTATGFSERKRLDISTTTLLRTQDIEVTNIGKISQDNLAKTDGVLTQIFYKKNPAMYTTNNAWITMIQMNYNCFGNIYFVGKMWGIPKIGLVASAEIEITIDGVQKEYLFKEITGGVPVQLDVSGDHVINPDSVIRVRGKKNSGTNNFGSAEIELHYRDIFGTYSRATVTIP